jgi:acetyl esterase/lipase
MPEAPWSAERFGDEDGPLVAMLVHGGFWRARWAADTTVPLARACAAAKPHPWVWNIEYPRVGMPGGGWPGTAVAVREALRAAVEAAAGRPVVVIGHSAGGHLALGAAPDSGLYAAASPIARLPLGVPALLIHGDGDEDVPVSQSRRFEKAARAAGDDCELHELPGGGHDEVIDPGGRGRPILNGRLAALAGA